MILHLVDGFVLYLELIIALRQQTSLGLFCIQAYNNKEFAKYRNLSRWSAIGSFSGTIRTSDLLRGPARSLKQSVAATHKKLDIIHLSWQNAPLSALAQATGSVWIDTAFRAILPRSAKIYIFFSCKRHLSFHR